VAQRGQSSGYERQPAAAPSARNLFRPVLVANGRGKVTALRLSFEIRSVLTAEHLVGLVHCS
jgi:hypothetical protein